MSARAGDVIEAMWAAFATGGAEAGFAFFGPEVAWHGTVGGLTEGDELRGHGNVVEGFADMIQEWGSFVVELCGVLEADEDQAIGFFREVATGRVSGLETTTHSALLFTVADGRIVRARPFLDGGEALAAAGVDASAQPRPVDGGQVDFGALAGQLGAGP